MRALIINGPNINLLGKREPQIYGSRDYRALCEYIEAHCAERGVSCELFQSNHEGAIVDKIQEADGCFDCLIINPAAYTHTSVAILDAIKAVAIPTAEVHLSDPDKREDFRRISYIREAAELTVSGLGFDSYIRAIDYFADRAAKDL